MIENIIFKLYKLTRPILNKTRKQKLQQKKTYEGTLNQLFNEELKDCNYVRFIKLDSQKRISALKGSNEFILSNLKYLSNGIKQNFKISYFKNQDVQTTYIELDKNKKLQDEYLLIKATKPLTILESYAS